MKRFIVVTNDGKTFDSEDNEVENCQIIDFVEAENIHDANRAVINRLNNKEYGAFEDFTIYEINSN